MPLNLNMEKEVTSSNLVMILFHENARPHVENMILQKFTGMGYEAL